MIPNFVVKSRKSVDVKAIPLSATKVSGSPWVANSFHRAHIVARDDIVHTGPPATWRGSPL